MYRMVIDYVENKGYRVVFDYLNNEHQESFETLEGLNKKQVNELIESKGGFYTPYYKGFEIGKLW